MAKQVRVRRKRKRKALVVTASVAGFLILVCCLLQAGVEFKHKHAVWSPSYEKLDITGLISKDRLSESEYKTVMRQTGLTKAGFDAAVSQKDYQTVLDIQKDFFKKRKLLPEYFAAFTCCDRTNLCAKTLRLENGDILITSSTHFSVFDIGHAAIVVDAENGVILNATGYDSVSVFETVQEITCRATFMVLRPKLSKEKRQAAAQYAVQNLEGLPYSVTVGFFGDKYLKKVTKTSCGHIVWYAYKKMGIDIDSNGGALVMPADILRSDKLELLQAFGADPEK